MFGDHLTAGSNAAEVQYWVHVEGTSSGEPGRRINESWRHSLITLITVTRVMSDILTPEGGSRWSPHHLHGSEGSPGPPGPPLDWTPATRWQTDQEPRPEPSWSLWTWTTATKSTFRKTCSSLQLLMKTFYSVILRYLSRRWFDDDSPRRLAHILRRDFHLVNLSDFHVVELDERRLDSNPTSGHFLTLKLLLRYTEHLFSRQKRHENSGTQTNSAERPSRYRRGV